MDPWIWCVMFIIKVLIDFTLTLCCLPLAICTSCKQQLFICFCGNFCSDGWWSFQCTWLLGIFLRGCVGSISFRYHAWCEGASSCHTHAWEEMPNVILLKLLFFGKIIIEYDCAILVYVAKSVKKDQTISHQMVTTGNLAGPPGDQVFHSDHGSDC